MYLGEHISTVYSEDQNLQPAIMEVFVKENVAQKCVRVLSKLNPFFTHDKKVSASVDVQETVQKPETQTVEKTVYVDRIVEKPVYVDRIVEKPVYVDRIVEVKKPVAEKETSVFFDDYMPAEWAEETANDKTEENSVSA